MSSSHSAAAVTTPLTAPNATAVAIPAGVVAGATAAGGRGRCIFRKSAWVGASLGQPRFRQLRAVVRRLR